MAQQNNAESRSQTRETLNYFFFSSKFETVFTEHSPCEMLCLNFEKKTVYLNYNFPIQWSSIITPERIQ